MWRWSSLLSRFLPGSLELIILRGMSFAARSIKAHSNAATRAQRMGWHKSVPQSDSGQSETLSYVISPGSIEHEPTSSLNLRLGVEFLDIELWFAW